MSLNFTMSELIKSDTAIKYNINNMPDVNALDNMLKLIWYVLQPLRVKIGKPIIITNGYRSTALLNKFEQLGLKPARNSQHCFGQAADLVVKGVNQRDLFYLVKTSGIPYDQLIWEQDNNCVHVSYNHGKNRKESLIRNSRGQYTKL